MCRVTAGVGILRVLLQRIAANSFSRFSLASLQEFMCLLIQLFFDNYLLGQFAGISIFFGHRTVAILSHYD